MRQSVTITALTVMLAAGGARAQPAIDAFNAVCFKAGQTAAQARENMHGVVGAPLPFTLTFWDKTLEPAPGTPDYSERRCEVVFDGDHAVAAERAVREKMAQPPVFGTPIALPGPYALTGDTMMLEARALLRGRVAVVEVATLDEGGRTRISVERLPAGYEGIR